MPINLPYKQSGQRLSKRHVNTLTEVARRQEAPTGNSFGIRRDRQVIQPPPHNQRRATIVAEAFDLGEAGNVIGIYEARFLYWDEGVSSSTSDQSSSSSSALSSSQEPQGDWVIDGTGHPVFVDGIDEEDGFDIGDKLIVYYDDQRGMWIPIRGGTVVEETTAATCCGSPSPCGQMSIDGFYSRRYQVEDIPERFGGVGTAGTLILEYVGLRPSTGYYYWESDEFDIVCDDGTDIYFWRMEVWADGNSACKSEGSDVAKLYIVRKSASSVCGDLTAVNCTSACSGALEQESSSSSSS